MRFKKDEDGVHEGGKGVILTQQYQRAFLMGVGKTTNQPKA